MWRVRGERATVDHRGNGRDVDYLKTSIASYREEKRRSYNHLLLVIYKKVIYIL